MGGELRECGCFDGPWSAEDDSLVSVRCDEHFDEVPPLSGYTLLRRNRWGITTPAARNTRTPRMATSIKTRRRRG